MSPVHYSELPGVNYVRKIKHNDSFTNERFNTVPRCEIAKNFTAAAK